MISSRDRHGVTVSSRQTGAFSLPPARAPRSVVWTSWTRAAYSRDGRQLTREHLRLAGRQFQTRELCDARDFIIREL
jgi:hypothetical protein